MNLIEISRVSKFYSGKSILNSISLNITKGELCVVFGPNGSGKTTLLNLIAGIIEPDSGHIRILGRPPNEERIGFVFQDYRESLLPWRTNLENIAFPQELEGIPKEERLKNAQELVNSLDLKIPLKSYPYKSSGGEQQLVALLREILAKPKIILMDEPFSSLDLESRSYLRVKLQEIWEKLGLTIILVTHDINEAIQLGNKIVVLDASSGKVAKIVNIFLKRPRIEEKFYTKEFRALRKRVISWK